MSPAGLLRWLAAQGITQTFLPTPLAEAVLTERLPADLRLERLLTGGDRLHRAPSGLPFQVLNHYGPTEATVVTTWSPVEEGSATPPIGRPVSNLRVCLLDGEGRRPVPLGVVGELCIAGPGLARGYLGRSALTAEKFVPDPFGAFGERLYHTGDLARYLPTGEFQFAGRRDNQVKIRGFRIEPGEVEAVLGGHGAVAEAAVILQVDPLAEPGPLVAFVVLRPGAAAGVDELRAFLAARVPGYMIPAAFVVCESLPLSANGKLDRRRLRVPATVDAGVLSVPPRTPLEEMLADLCADVLRLGRIGVYDNFLERGGHSLQVVQILSRVRDDLGVEVSPAAVLADPTVAGLSVAIAAALVAETDAGTVGELLAEVDQARTRQ